VRLNQSSTLLMITTFITMHGKHHQFDDTVVISMDFGVHCQMGSAGMITFKLCSREVSSSISDPSFQNEQSWRDVLSTVGHSHEWPMLILFSPLPEDIHDERCGQNQCFELVWAVHCHSLCGWEFWWPGIDVSPHRSCFKKSTLF